MVALSGKGWVLAAPLVSLYLQLNATAPRRSTVSDGSIGDAAHSSRASDHNPVRGVVRALDITDDPAGGMDALWLREALRASEDPRIRYVISEGQMFSAYPTAKHPAWTWRPYNGVNGHFQHVHISVVEAPIGDRSGMWNLSRDFAAPVRPPAERPRPTPEDDMTPEQEQTLNEAHWMLSQMKPLVDRLVAIQKTVDEIRWAVTDPAQGLRRMVADLTARLKG